MYLRILKRDLKRKRTMNVILLLFITLATLFVSGSVNNIISVTTALDNYLEMANAPDFLGGTMNKAGSGDLKEMFEGMESVDSYRTEPVLYLSSNMITGDNKEVEIMGGTMLLQGDEKLALNYFLADNSILKDVAPGKMYITGHMMEKQKISVGDRITITIEDKSKEFFVAGSINDAVLGANQLTITRYIVDEEDYGFFYGDKELTAMKGGELYYIETADKDAMLTEISEAGGSFIFSMDRAYMRFCYIFDMIVTGILLAVSVLLIVISFVVLRFTITFTLEEEFREIGVMKAIGIKNRKIRGLYLVKYAMLAVVGAAVGLWLSYPFGRLLMKISSGSVIVTGEKAYLSNVLCSVAVVGVILLFGYGCTRRVINFTPVDAIRNGQTGERFRKKSLMSLGKSRLTTTGFLATNDIVSSPKRYSIVTLTFALCLCITLMMSVSASTLKSEKLLSALNMLESHAVMYILVEGEGKNFMTEGGREALEKYLEEMEETLSEQGMPATCVQDLIATFPVKYGDREEQIPCFQATGAGADQFDYIEGTAPEAPGEIALTRLAAESIGADIGDTVVIVSQEGEREYLITALFQSMNNRGYTARFHEEEEINYVQMSGGVAGQITFLDHPSRKEVKERIEKINAMGKYGEVQSTAQFVEEAIGVAPVINAIKGLMMGLTMVMVVLVTVLLERSFIAKEKKEIALMKAMGMKNGKIYGYHTARFAITGVVSVVLAELLLLPLLRLCIDPIFKMMGMEVAVDYSVNPMEVFVVLPLVVLGTTLLTAFLTSLYTRKIKAADVAGQE